MEANDEVRPLHKTKDEKSISKRTSGSELAPLFENNGRKRSGTSVYGSSVVSMQSCTGKSGRIMRSPPSFSVYNVTGVAFRLCADSLFAEVSYCLARTRSKWCAVFVPNAGRSTELRFDAKQCETRKPGNRAGLVTSRVLRESVPEVCFGVSFFECWK